MHGVDRIFNGLLVLFVLTGPAMAGIPFPAPEMGEGVLGFILAAGAVYAIRGFRRR